MMTDAHDGRTSTSTLLTLNQTAETLQVSVKSVRRWIKSGELIAHRIGHQWRVSKPDLQTFIRARRNS